MDKKKVTIVGVVVAILVVMVGFFVVNQKGSIQKDLMSQEWTMYDAKTSDPDKVKVTFTNDKMIVYPNHSSTTVSYNYQVNGNVFSMTPSNETKSYKVTLTKDNVNYRMIDDDKEYLLVPRLND